MATILKPRIRGLRSGPAVWQMAPLYTDALERHMERGRLLLRQRSNGGQSQTSEHTTIVAPGNQEWADLVDLSPVRLELDPTTSQHRSFEEGSERHYLPTLQ